MVAAVCAEDGVGGGICYSIFRLNRQNCENDFWFRQFYPSAKKKSEETLGNFMELYV